MAKVIVIGAGPAGIMAAITAAENHKVVLIDSNEKIAKKLFITGKGRCNITNAKDIGDFFDYIPGNPHFLYSALYSFTNNDVIEMIENEGTKLKVERGGRVFPESDKSSDIIKALSKKLSKAKVDIRLNSKVTDVFLENDIIKSVEINGSEIISADYFIIATGGASYPLTGSRGEGQVLAEKMGHKIIDLKPSLVPVELNGDWFKELIGLTLKNIKLDILDSKNKVKYSNQGEMKFTSYGISGPIVLSGSRFIDYKDTYSISIDLKPSLDEKELDLRIQKDFKKYINKDFRNSLDDLLPQKMIPLIIKLSMIDPYKKVNEITKVERKNLVNAIKNIKGKVKGLRPLAEAIVTSGGVSTLEIDPSTMKSKIINNLSFAGEVIDVDAFTGGYNVQIALSTGYLAGKYL
ncbi:MAG: NAD(P)/FAD-dependent oxidoreductase [Clostridium sp.]|uniref:NAD(P)/FAD-dependent oxidoreductase n=2 Tax=Clostridium sp. TaxID=1506 RepID=UPI0026726BC9|nr:NAD(P)/FAD-dependent oxidoreductase [Clostridium sp.]MCI7029784.1 NAD(P)/FAD-dependent oxidoreductase [Clostridium sp.]MDD7681595.1 NAD(P)/FAD-dependent oxidoreductase [Clostridium sp.]MDY2579159.1 NAD(P)/FAD-dependent oxidoreductase [Clostridium sp.]